MKNYLEKNYPVENYSIKNYQINSHNIRKMITDYHVHKDEIESWFELKGIISYCKYANILFCNNLEIDWEMLVHLYRYDKRLHLVLYKYTSFLEEFLRSLLFKITEEENKRIDRYPFSTLLYELESKAKKINSVFLNKEVIFNFKDTIIEIRNMVAHSKILISKNFEKNLSLVEVLDIFKKSLPSPYQDSFEKKIISCKNGLTIPKKLVVN